MIFGLCVLTRRIQQIKPTGLFGVYGLFEGYRYNIYKYISNFRYSNHISFVFFFMLCMLCGSQNINSPKSAKMQIERCQLGIRWLINSWSIFEKKTCVLLVNIQADWWLIKATFIKWIENVFIWQTQNKVYHRFLLIIIWNRYCRLSDIN